MKCPICFNEMAEVPEKSKIDHDFGGMDGWIVFVCKDHGEFTSGSGEMWLHQDKDGIRHMYYFDENGQFTTREKYSLETKQRIL